MTAKMRAALEEIAIGQAHMVTWQMLRKLDAQKMIDFSNADGWHLTEYGWNAISQATPTL